MNLQIAQLLSAASASPTADTRQMRSALAAQMPQADIQRLPNATTQITSPQLLAGSLTVTDSVPPSTNGLSAIARTAERQLTLFDILPLRKTISLSQADTQRLTTALADGITLSTLSQTKAAQTFTLNGTVEDISGRVLRLNLQMPGSPAVKLTVPESAAQNLQRDDRVSLTMQPQSHQPDSSSTARNSAGQQWQISLVPKNQTGKEMQFSVGSSSPVVKLAIAKVLASGGVQLEQVLSTVLQKNLGLAVQSGIQNSSLHLLNVSTRGSQLDVRGVEARAQVNLKVPDEINLLQPVADKRLSAHSTQSSLKTMTALVSGVDVATQPAVDKVSSGHDSKLSVNNASFRLPATPLISADEVPVVQDKIRQLSRQLLAQTGSTSEALTRLTNILQHPGADLSADSKAVSKHLLTQLLSLQPQQQEAVQAMSGDRANSPSTAETSSQPDSQHIRQLLQAPALLTTPSSLLSSGSQSGFINALVSLLQISLAGRAARIQPGLNKIIDSSESRVGRNISSGNQPSRVASDFAQLDGRTKLLDQVKALLANHQQQKIQSADTRIQGQDSLYYVLPVLQEDQRPPELVMRSEERDAKEEKGESGKQRVWHLTMKLSVGNMGEMLAKTKINDDAIELRIYTSSETLLVKVLDTLPLLLRRLKGLGLDVEHYSCERGKIPASLKDAPYQLFETIV